MSSLYDRYILPKLLTCACSGPVMMQQRTRIVPKAEGRVLELGIGMGLNLPFYDPAKVTEVIGVDPAHELRVQAEAAPRPEASRGEAVRVRPVSVVTNGFWSLALHKKRYARGNILVPLDLECEDRGVLP